MTNCDGVPFHLISGQHVVIAAFDEVPEHNFQVFTVEDGFVTGVALTGPLAGEYGEPAFELILRLHDA
jgi:hypothetical protein